MRMREEIVDSCYHRAKTAITICSTDLHVEERHGILFKLSLRGLQILKEKMHSRVRICTVFSTRPASQIRERPQDIRGKQHYKAAERAPSAPERRCSEFFGI